MNVESSAQVVVLEDNFSNGYTSDPAWTVNGGSWSWTSGNDFVSTAGTASNAYLATTDFVPIETGVFSLSVDVQFSSSTVSGNNRFYLRMRDSTNSLAGYEIAIAQGTMANSTINNLGTATKGTTTVTSTPYTFALDTWTTITWTRDAEGAMSIYVGDQLYMSTPSSSVGYYDRLEIGGRVYINETTSYTYSFTNVTLATVPEPTVAGLLVTGGLTTLLLRRRRRAIA